MNPFIFYGLMAAAVLPVLLVILLLLLKKLPLSWGISLIVCALILGGVGYAGIRYQREQEAENYGYIYMALSYMEEGELDPAALYLKRANLENDYCLLSAQALLEQMRSNTTMAKFRLDMLNSFDRLSVDQEDGIDLLRKAGSNDSDNERAARALQDLIPLSESRKNELQRKFEMERGDLDEDQLEKMDKENRLRLEINQAISQENSKTALTKAIELVHLSPSQDNRLLLASVIAEVTYNDGKIKTSHFSLVEGPVKVDTQEQEADLYGEQYEDICDDLEKVEAKIETAEGEKLVQLIEEQRTLSEQAEVARTRAEHVFVYRALNSIADIYTLEAQIVQAKLYYAMRNYEEAFQVLDAAANSSQAKYSNNETLLNALDLVLDTYQRENVIGLDSPEFRQGMQTLMGSAHPDLISFSLSPLATDFAEHLIDDQKSYGTGLYVINLDQSQYPTIQVQLGGQESVIERVANKEAVVLSDTYNTVTAYDVQEAHAAQGLNSICFVVDTSGSMDGQPIEDVRKALLQFLNDVDSYTEMSLVLFDSGAVTSVGLTMNAQQMENGIRAITSGGGTNISSGIQTGTAALSAAKGTQTMILMTDGQSSVDSSVIQAAVDQGITIFTIGFGGVNDQLLQSIADASGGQYLRAETSTELASIYNSLRRVIGNTVTLTYTVTDENTERYFYLRDDNSGLSAREVYQLGSDSAAEDSTGGMSITSAPVFQTREDLNSLLERQTEYFTLAVNGTQLSKVNNVMLGTTICPISSQSDSYLRVQVPVSISDGAYDLTLRALDGSKLVVPRQLWVGSRVDHRYYSAGDLSFYAYNALLLPDGQLVLGNSVSISDNSGAQGELQTVSVQLAGVISFPIGVDSTIFAEMEGLSYSDVIRIGENGTANAWGALKMERSDKAYYSYADTTLFTGEMVLNYSSAASQFTTSEVSGS